MKNHRVRVVGLELRFRVENYSSLSEIKPGFMKGIISRCILY